MCVISWIIICEVHLLDGMFENQFKLKDFYILFYIYMDYHMRNVILFHTTNIPHYCQIN